MASEYALPFLEDELGEGEGAPLHNHDSATATYRYLDMPPVRLPLR